MQLNWYLQYYMRKLTWAERLRLTLKNNNWNTESLSDSWNTIIERNKHFSIKTE